MNGPALLTFGCRLNLAESEAMRGLAADQHDLVIVNSCAVTAEAVRQAKKAIRKMGRERPDARILVTGCAAQIEPETFAAMPEVARVIGNADKHAPAAFRFPRPPLAEVQVSDIFAVRQHTPHLARAFAEHARAFVEVQTGCDHRCTFCVIPYGRGNSRSAPAGAVVDRIAALVAAGHREVVLTGVDLTSYGGDLPGAPSLAQLIERILRHVPALPRLRLSSLDSIEIDDRLFELVTQEPRLMPHVHLSLQSGDDMILKRMKRRHDRAQAVALVARLKAARPEIAIGADIIAGFPTEATSQAANTLALIEDCDIVFGHVFPYSPRPGTPAARMPQVPLAEIKSRAATLRAAAAARRRAWLEGMIGSVQPMLVERDGLTGHADNFADIRLLQPLPAGTVQAVRIIGREEDSLVARPA